MIPPFASILHREALRRLSDARTFERGQQYHTDRRVSEVARRDAALVATVRGDKEYRVRIWVKDNTLAYSCTCPVGADGDFCKHAVAAGLAFVEQDERPETRIPSPVPAPPEPTRPGTTTDRPTARGERSTTPMDDPSVQPRNDTKRLAYPTRPGALALAWVDEARGRLGQLDKTALIDLVVECGLEDASFRELVLRAVRAR
jgi:hypothetical protein